MSAHSGSDNFVIAISNYGCAGRCRRLALRLQVLTATRRGEVANVEWKDINMEKMVWVIPSGKYKTKRQHSVPLSPQAMKILNEAKELSRDSMWVFPTPHYIEDKPITGSAINRAVTRNLGIFGVEKFVPHDLRRTAATIMTSIGIPATTVSKVLAHVEGGVTAIYDRYGYDLEKRRALEAWGRKLESIITGKQTAKVVELRK